MNRRRDKGHQLNNIIISLKTIGSLKCLMRYAAMPRALRVAGRDLALEVQ